MSELLKQILGSTIITTLITSVIVYFFHKRTEKQNALIKREFEKLSQKDTAHFEWRKSTVELLGQVYIHLNRTSLGFKNSYSKLKKYDPFYENEIMYHSNKHIRDLLINNGHYLPPELLDEATKLIEHFDVWLTKYNQVRTVEKNDQARQIYVGPDGFRFQKMRKKCLRTNIWRCSMACMNESLF